MECPYCLKEIPATAVRCRYCRRVLKGYARDKGESPLKKIMAGVARRTGVFFTAGRAPAACPWSYVDVVLISLLLWLFISNDPFHLGSGVLRYLRFNFPSLVGKPRLLWYLGTYINTMIFKAISLVLVIALVKARGANIFKTVFSAGDVPETWWRTYLPIYAIACLVFRDISALNPLVPNLPFDSVFTGAKVVGNIVVIFSVILIAPIVEEAIFRGFLYPAINKYVGMHPAVFVTSALFMLAHYPQVRDEPVFAATLFLLGLIITYARALTGSTLLAILMHHIYNLMYVAIGLMNYLILRY